MRIRNPPKILKSPPHKEETPPHKEETPPRAIPKLKTEIKLPPLESTGELAPSVLPKLVVKPTRTINDFYKAPQISKLSVLPPRKRKRSQSSEDSDILQQHSGDDMNSNLSPVVVRIPTEVSNDPHAEEKLKLLDDNHC